MVRSVVKILLASVALRRAVKGSDLLRFGVAQLLFRLSQRSTRSPRGFSSQRTICLPAPARKAGSPCDSSYASAELAPVGSNVVAFRCCPVGKSSTEIHRCVKASKRRKTTEQKATATDVSQDRIPEGPGLAPRRANYQLQLRKIFNYFFSKTFRRLGPVPDSLPDQGSGGGGNDHVKVYRSCYRT